MKTLKTVQTLAKVGRVLSKIVFIFCVIGFCGCVIGIIGVAAGGHVFLLFGTPLEEVIVNEAGMTAGTLYASMTAGLILCAGEAVLAAFAEHYFKREAQDGTPFTAAGANEMMRLGVLAIAIPLGAQILAAIAHVIIKTAMEGVEPLNLDAYGSVGMGIMFILTSLICRYGAERTHDDETVKTAAMPREEIRDGVVENFGSPRSDNDDREE